MIRYVIKNNFKLMLRNKWAVCVLLIGPLVVIFLLSNAFRSLMESYEAPDEFKVGYREYNSALASNMDSVKEAAKEAGIIFGEYPEGEPAELIEKNELSAFVEFDEDEYKLYKSSEHKTEGSITGYFLERMKNEGANAVLASMMPETELVSSVPVSRIDFMPSIDSTDYYGIIYIVYMASCGFIVASGVLTSEKKHGIEKKYHVCSMTSMQLYLSRLIPTSAMIIVTMFVETIITVILFGIHWGSPLLSALVTSLMIIAAVALGLMLYSLTRSIAFTIMLEFIVIWIMGFIGGTFETYMFSSMPETLKNISPLYHANRALVELSCMGHSDHIGISVIFSLALTAVFSVIAVAADMIRKRGKA